MQKNKSSQDYWIETCWQTLKKQQDFLLANLSEFNVLGSFENIPLDTIIENDDVIELKVYLPDNPQPQNLKKDLQKLESKDTQLTHLERIPMGDWATAWKKYFHPFHLTDKIVICPSWESYTQQKNEIVVTLDPGMAFGTGQHDTTRFCAQAITSVIKENPNTHSLLDVGCGSGILSIIAAKVGYKKITGIDIDIHAIETSHENLERNPEITKNQIQFLQTDEDLNSVENQKFDVVVANIFAETLVELKYNLLDKLKDNGFLILSGIMFQSDKLIEQNFGELELLNKESSDDWHAYIYRKK